MASSYPGTGGTTIVTTASAQTITGAKTFLAGSATSVPVTVQAAVGQTANMMEWKNGAGTVLAYVTAAGIIAGSGNNYFNNIAQGAGSTSAFFSANMAGQIGLMIRGFSGQTGNLQEWQDSAGTVLSSVGSLGRMSIGPAGDLFGMLNVSALGATAIGIRVRGFASQTGNLQEWQNSAGTNLGFFSSGGNFVTAGFIQAGGTGSAGAYIGDTGSWNSYIKTLSTGQTGLAIRGSVGQTGTLQEWQDSTGTAVASIKKEGTIVVPVMNAGNFIVDSASGVQACISTTAANNRGLLIRGFTGQTGFLMEVQNAAGTAGTGFDMNTRLYINEAIVGAGGSIATQAGASLGSFYVNVNGTARRVPYFT